MNLNPTLCALPLKFSLVVWFGFSALPALLQAQLPEAEPFDNALNYFSQSQTYQLEFDQLPSNSQWNDWASQGIYLLDYLGNTSFLVSLPESITPKQLDEEIKFKILGPADKINTYFSSSQIQQLNASCYTALLRYYPQVPKAAVLNTLAQEGVEVEYLFSLLPMVEICTSPKTLVHLAQQKWVHYIEVRPNSFTPDAYFFSSGPSPTFASTGALHIPYTGSGIMAAIGDDGPLGPHIDFQGRILEESDAWWPSNGAHGDQVAGIMASAGLLRSEHRGVAPGLDLMMLSQFDAIKRASELVSAYDLELTCTALSDSCNGGYTNLASLTDRQLWEFPHLMHIFSAGNAGQENCNYGAGPGWGNITGGAKVAKNALTVGNTTTEDVLVPTSSKGPVSDGRLKPDICAPGQEITTTLPHQQYGTISGTSAAAPGVAGVFALLQEAYSQLNNGQKAPSALLKAYLLNTATDIGKPGPDFESGWGRVDPYKAYDCLKKNQYLKGGLFNGTSYQTQISIPSGIREVRFMLYWHDKEGSPSPLADQSLVNDLDLKMYSPDSTLLLPLVLDPSPLEEKLMKAAQPGEDHLNNVEQVRLYDPDPGTYTLHVNGYQVPYGPQHFYVTYCFIRDDIKLNYPVSGSRLPMDSMVTVHWDAYGKEGAFRIDYSLDGGNSWLLADTAAGDQRQLLWRTPNQPTSQAILRISRASESTQNLEPFIIGGSPNPRVAQKCVHSLVLEWPSCDWATEYEVYRLGENDFEWELNTSDTFVTLDITPGEEAWFAVSTVFEDGQTGPRSKAIQSPEGPIHCSVENDLGLLTINSPQGSIRPDCHTYEIPIEVTLKNTGLLPQSNFCIFAQYDQQPIQSVCFDGTIPPGVPLTMTFDSMLQPGLPGQHLLRVWVAAEGDQLPLNDTLSRAIQVVSGQTFSLPYIEDFDAFPLCASEEDCSLKCSLQSGWHNEFNGSADDLDWRPRFGATPTRSTGPRNDQNQQNQIGQYLYLESTGCPNNRAALLSPCLDLTGAQSPVAGFWYHQLGAESGGLYVDVFDGDKWTLQYSSIGNQGDQWQRALIDLTPFSDKSITLRFRGVTGDGFLSDIAIDHVAVFDQSQGPISAFFADRHTVCTHAPIRLLDNSWNLPVNWNWIVSGPATFLEGTAVNSKNPVISFSVPGTYQVYLQTSNLKGSHLSAPYTFTVTNGTPLPYQVNFDDHPFPENWSILNPDESISWDLLNVIQKDGQTGNALFINNHNYLQINAEDILRTASIDLSDATHPMFRFDYSYATPSNSNYSDRLIVKLYTNCGETLDTLLFDRSGAALATVDKAHSSWRPQKSHHWGKAMIDLKPYIGQNVQLELVSICGFGNNLYVDNLLFYEKDQLPVTRISPLPEALCVNDTLSLEGMVEGGSPDSIRWLIRQNDQDHAVFTTVGPHSFAWSEPGSAEVYLRSFSELGMDQSVALVQVFDNPIADFDFYLNANGSYSFSNQSQSATSWLWDFGDGQFSHALNPEHFYEQTGSYTVTLTVENACSQATVSLPLEVIITQTREVTEADRWKIYPNPAQNTTTLERSGSARCQAPIRLDIIDLTGRPIRHQKLPCEGAHPVDISGLPAGLYFFKLSSEEESIVKKVQIYR